MKAKPDSKREHWAGEVVTRSKEEWLDHEVAESNFQDAG
jgi:hypothetical protein